MMIVGIDPGLTGAIVTIFHDDIRFFDTPTFQVKSGKKKRNEYNEVEMAKILKSNTIVNCHFALEKIHSMSGQGVASMFKMGVGYGIWKGIIAAMEKPVTLITPQAWKKEMMAGMGKEKDASRQRALELFPKLSEELKLKKHHGRADALLIAEYLRRKLNV